MTQTYSASSVYQEYAFPNATISIIYADNSQFQKRHDHNSYQTKGSSIDDYATSEDLDNELYFPNGWYQKRSKKKADSKTDDKKAKSPQLAGFPNIPQSDFSPRSQKKSPELEKILNSGKVVPAHGENHKGSEYEKANLVKDSYQQFKEGYLGKELASKIGDVKFDGYGMLDLGEGALAAVISYGDGKQVLAWNKNYEHVLQNPEKHARHYLEAMVHESIHGAGVHSETKTYNAVGDFFQNQSYQAKGGLENLYDAISKESRYKATIYGENAPYGPKVQGFESQDYTMPQSGYPPMPGSQGSYSSPMIPQGNYGNAPAY